MKHLYIAFFLTFAAFYTNAQESVRSKILDSISQKPIPYATIALNNKSGVISNDYGVFNMYLPKNLSDKDSIYISCLGYETKPFLVKTFSDSIVLLSPKAIELKEVVLSNKILTAEEIIAQIKNKLPQNYDFEFVKNKLFYRESYFTNIIKNEVTIKKTTIPEFNQNYIDSLLFIMPKKSDEYTEILGDKYGKTGNPELQKLDIIKASHLYDKSLEIKFEGFEERFNEIIKKHIKRDSYFKIKSGIFGTKEEIDSSFFDGTKTKETEETEAFIEAEKKRELERKQNFLKYRKRTITNLEKSSFIFEDTHLNFLEKSNKYDFELLGYVFLNNDFVYQLNFSPKRGADYKGTLYVNTDDFAIVRIDYENVKALRKFNLLGISYNEHLKKGTLIYTKNNINKYSLKYAEMENGTKFGINRPLKIIEKNKHVRGRRKQNEISGDIHFILSNITKKELVIFESEHIAEETFNALEEQADVKPTYLPKYDPDFWKGYNIIEPNQAIKDFKSIK